MTRYYILYSEETKEWVSHRGGMGSMTKNKSQAHVFDSQKLTRGKAVENFKTGLRKTVVAQDW